MLTTLFVVLVVSGALLVGAAWGIWGSLPSRLEGFLIALAGGSLMMSLVSELIEPSVKQSSLTVAMVSLAAGAIVFTGVDWLIDEKWGSEGGRGIAGCDYPGRHS